MPNQLLTIEQMIRYSDRMWNEQAEEFKLSEKDRKEGFYLTRAALGLPSPEEVPSLQPEL